MSRSGTEYEYIPANMCFNAQHETNFAELDMDTMKAMVSASDPGQVMQVADGWESLRNQLVGGGDGGIRGVFKKAVDEVLQDWKGEAADRFKAEAEKISKKIFDGSEYARYTSVAMRNAGNALSRIKPEVMAMEKPSAASSAWDWATDSKRDDTGLRNDLKDTNKTTQQALDNNRDSLSKGKEAQLAMAVKMEELGGVYVSQYKAMGSWKGHSKYGNDEDYPGAPGGTAPVPMPVGPAPSAPKPSNRGPLTPTGKGPGFSPDVKTPRPEGVHGGVGQVKPSTRTPEMPKIGTGLDSFNPNPGVPGGGGPHTATPNGGLGPINGGPNTGPNGGSNTFLPGTPGVPSGTGRGIGANRGTPSGTTTGRGVIGNPGGTSGSQTGRPGMPGGMGGTGGGAGGGRAGIAGRGALARTPGGVVGTPGGKASGTAQGGSALHRSRGGTQAGEGAGNRRPNGMMGMPGSRGANGEEKNEGGKRPDYLVEDEETWTPERNVAPKVIE